MSNEQAYLASRMRSGANWFYWIAGLSVVNLVITFIHGGIRFLGGLGVTDIIAGTLGIGSPMGLGVSGVITALFCVFGYFAQKGNKATFIIGMILYLLDGVLTLLAKDYLATLVHGYVLFRLFQGLQAAQQYGALAASANASAFDRSNQPTQPGVWPPPPNA